MSSIVLLSLTAVAASFIMNRGVPPQQRKRKLREEYEIWREQVLGVPTVDMRNYQVDDSDFVVV